MTSMMTSMLVLLMLSVTCDLVSARSTLGTFWEELERLMNEKVPKKPMLTANILSGSTVPVGTEVMFTCATTSTPGAFTYTYQFNNVAFVVESGTYTHTLSSYKGKTIRIICSAKEKGGVWSENSDPYILNVTGQRINGNWGQWEDASSCSVSCGGGSRRRSRQCNNPPLSNGGDPCVGNGVITESCNTQMCPGSSSTKVTSQSLDDLIQQLNQEVSSLKDEHHLENKRLRDDMIQQLNQETSSLKADHDLAIQHLTDENQRLRLTVDQHIAKNKKMEIGLEQLRLNVTTRVAFSAVRETSSSEHETLTSSDQTVMFNKVLTNIGGGFDISTATFVCPVAGPYYITHDMTVYPGRYGATFLNVNGEAITASLTQDSKYYGNEGLGVVVELSKGDKVKVVAGYSSTFYWWEISSGNKQFYASVFSGFLLK